MFKNVLLCFLDKSAAFGAEKSLGILDRKTNKIDRIIVDDEVTAAFHSNFLSNVY